MVGTLVGVNAHEVRLQLRDSGETITVPLDEMQQGEFSREARSAAGRGALIGFLLGAVVGSAAGGCDCNQPGLARGFSGLLLGGLGSGIGALVGTGFRMEDWTPFQGPLAPPAARSPVRPRLFQIRVAF